MTLLARIAAFAAVALVIALTLGPVGVREMSPVDPLFDRALAYAVIGLLLILSFPRHPWRVVLAMLVMIVGLEVAQRFRPDRHGQMIDVVEKTVGAGIGVALGLGTLWVLRRRRPPDAHLH
jgi:hypothetical protein